MRYGKTTGVAVEVKAEVEAAGALHREVCFPHFEWIFLPRLPSLQVPQVVGSRNRTP